MTTPDPGTEPDPAKEPATPAVAAARARGLDADAMLAALDARVADIV